MKFFLIILIFISGCVSTTTNTDSNVSRQQLLILPEFMANSMAVEAYNEALNNADKNNKLNTDKDLLNRIRKISFKLIDKAIFFRDDAKEWKWEINVEDNEQVNAYCMPGGKIMVFSGLVEKTDATDDELAAVIGHEIVHALREHGRERMSTALIQQVGIIGFAAYIANKGTRVSTDAAVQAVALGTTLFFALPNSREQEREADKMGLELMAHAGYNPMAAVSLWRKMNELSEFKMPEFLSTHPSNENRIKDLTEHARKINHLYEENKKEIKAFHPTDDVSAQAQGGKGHISDGSEVQLP
ncbi:MAG: peptidase M48 [Nitrosomonadales bacterium]|nr:peptidase M48 [Nitrosomonadales bacterium]|tara:strand:+ start:15483 stop:16382 length:900 start_codon:yes stop_codon:yes gene_type:complete